MKTRCPGKRGFSLVEIMIVVALIGLLATIAIPNFMRARLESQKNACINNLRVIHAVKQQWALEVRKTASDVPNPSDVLPYLVRGGNDNPLCPSVGAGSTFDASYDLQRVDTAPLCKTVPAIHKMPTD